MKATIKKKCKECDKSIEVRLSDHNREQGNFCSRECAGAYNNRKRKATSKECEICGKKFTTKCGHAKFCSPSCKRHQNARLSKEARKRGEYRYHLAKKVRSEFGKIPCFECGWNASICDIHHIKGRKEGDHYSNLTIVCPNHHRLIHKGKLSMKNFKTLEDFKKEVADVAELADATDLKSVSC